MRSPGSPLGGRKPSPDCRKTPDRWDLSLSSASSSTASTSSKSSVSGRNPVMIAARAIGSCFSSPEMRSPRGAYSEDFNSPAVNSDSSHGNGRRRSDSYHGTERRRLAKGIYSSGYSPAPIEPGGMRFTMAEIHKATKSFSPSFKIGEGGFGMVYKGRLEDGTSVAIKRAKKIAYDKHQNMEFQSEIQTLARVEHLNLVKFLGYLEYQDERIVVVEYVPNGTLREHLDCLHGNPLDLATRLDIAIDVAHAVTYLHMYTDHPIIHRDIKSSNILLTENLRAKVADFGFARLGASETGVSHVSTQVKGTAGYLDPEYLRTYQLTEKSDVYSFGVLLVEILTGRHPIEPNREAKERITTRWVLKKFTDGNTIQTLDPNLPQTPASSLALEKILELAFECLAPTRQSRPSMRKCAEILWSIRKDYRELLSSDPLLLPSHALRNSSIKEGRS